MFNFALVAKILEVLGAKEEKINEQMENLAELVAHKFSAGFILFLNKKVTDQQLAEFSAFVDNSDKTDTASVTKCIDWAKNNLKDLDIEEFIDKFDAEMEELEMKIINEYKNDLTDAQRKELISFIQDQIKINAEAWDDFENVFAIEGAQKDEDNAMQSNPSNLSNSSMPTQAQSQIQPQPQTQAETQSETQSESDNTDNGDKDDDNDVKIIF